MTFAHRLECVSWGYDTIRIMAYPRYHLDSQLNFNLAYRTMHKVMGTDLNEDIINRTWGETYEGGMTHHDLVSAGFYYIPDANVDDIEIATDISKQTNFDWLTADYGVKWQIMVSLPKKNNSDLDDEIHIIGAPMNGSGRWYRNSKEHRRVEELFPGHQYGDAGVSLGMLLDNSEENHERLLLLDLIDVPFTHANYFDSETVARVIPDQLRQILFNTTKPSAINWATSVNSSQCWLWENFR